MKNMSGGIRVNVSVSVKSLVMFLMVGERVLKIHVMILFVKRLVNSLIHDIGLEVFGCLLIMVILVNVCVQQVLLIILIFSDAKKIRDLSEIIGSVQNCMVEKIIVKRYMDHG